MHCLSPGMVLTGLLLEGASDTNKQASYPATVHCAIVPLQSTFSAHVSSSSCGVCTVAMQARSEPGICAAGIRSTALIGTPAGGRSFLRCKRQGRQQCVE